MKNYKLKLTIILTTLISSSMILTACGNKDDAAGTTTTPTVSPSPQVEIESEHIGMPKAEEIALEHANKSAEDVENLTSSMDLDDPSTVKYIVEFQDGLDINKYVIHSKSGEILDHSITEGVDPTIPENTNFIGEMKAKEIAYKDADVTDSDFINIKLELLEDGDAIYDVEFYIGTKEYDYVINAITGTVISFDNDAELFDVSIPEDVIIGEAIGEEKAVEIARNDANAENTSNLFVKLNTEDTNNTFYLVEFLSNNTQYSYEIHSVTGEILFELSETDENAINGVIVDQNDEESPYIGDGKAVVTAVNHAGSDPTSEITIDFVIDGSKTRYHVGFFIDNTEYKYEIDGLNGKIMALDKETKNYNNNADSSTNSSNVNQDNMVIGDEAALDIALKFINADSASFIKVDFSYDNGIAIYEIDFRIDNVEHAFEIDAISGKILDYNKE